MYSHPHYTGDIDFWVESILENGRKIEQVFQVFGIASFGIAAEDFTKAEQIIQIGYPPHRIDIITSIDGLDFADAYPNRGIVAISDIPVSFIGLDDLKINKKASGRAKDLDDLENLE